MNGGMDEKKNLIPQTRKDLMDIFWELGLKKETILGIMSFLDTEKKETEMMNFLMSYYKKIPPSEQEILRKLKEIVT